MSWIKKATINKRAQTAPQFNPQDIYDSFILTLLLGQKFSPELERRLDFEAEYIKERVTTTFTDAMRKQIAKYISRPDRYVPDVLDWLKTYPTADIYELAMMLETATMRSERHRAMNPDEVRNERWGQIGQKAAELASTSGWKNIVLTLTGQGGLFNLVHNTGTSVLDKFSNGRQLLDALNFCQRNKDVRLLAQNASQDIRDIVREAGGF